MKIFYTIIGTALIGMMSWAQYVGWAPTEVGRIPNVPHSVRNNPGSYRSHYTYFYHHEGGK